MFRSRVFLVSLLAFPLSSLSFKIDDSCEKKGLTTLVRDGMNGAFEMVDSALNRLNKSPYDEETSNYIRWLFLPKEGQDPNDRQKMEKLRLVFNNIRVRYRQETHVPNDQVPANDVVCILLARLEFMGLIRCDCRLYTAMSLASKTTGRQLLKERNYSLTNVSIF